MIINIENDPQKGPGYARISLRARSGEALPEPASPPEFMIESPGRGEFLGNGQWMQSEVKLAPDGYTYENGAIILNVGPQIVDNLEALENYRFSITMPSGEKSGALVCKNLIPSPMQGSRTGFGSFDAQQPEPAPSQEPAPEPAPAQPPLPPLPSEPPQPVEPPPVLQETPPAPQPAPEPAPVYTPPDFSRSNEPPLHLSPEQGQGGTFEQLAHGTPPKKSGGGKTLLILLLIIILLAGLAAGAWYFLSHRTADPDDTTPDETVPTEVDPGDGEDGNGDINAPDPTDPDETDPGLDGNGQGDGDPEANPAEDPANQPANQPNSQPNSQPDAGKPGTDTPPSVQPKDSANLQSLHLARGILRDNPSDDDLRRALTMMPLDDGNADANFLLREELAERGDAESMFMLGQFYDPAVNMPRGTIERDPEQALNWYRQAQSGGWQSTGPALDNLKAWLQQEAEHGNPEAERLLNSME